MKAQKRPGIGLTFLLVLLVFVVISVTQIITMPVVLFLIQCGWLPKEPSLVIPMITTGLLSIAVGTVVTLLVNRIPLRPIRSLISVTKELAAGNFDVRVHLNGPRELKEFSEAFNRMAQELGSIEILRTDFVNNFSHEFKTPIVSLRGFARLLQDETLDAEKRQEYVGIIIDESERLLSLATNVLYLSKIDNQTILEHQTPLNLSEQVRHAILMMEPKWSGKKLELSVELDEITCTGNEEMLRQVWLNLIDNAVKFSPEGGRLRVELVRTEQYALFRIEDQGCGMDENTQMHVFDRFYQGDSSHSTAGNGLGLAIVKKIVELHCGSVSVRSWPGVGCVFSVTLPIG